WRPSELLPFFDPRGGGALRLRSRPWLGDARDRGAGNAVQGGSLRRSGDGGRAGVAQAEDRDGFSHVDRQAAQRLGRRRGFLDERRILLRGLVELGDGLARLRDAGALLRRGRGDLGDQLRYLGHVGDDLLHGLAGTAGHLRARVHLLDRLADERLDLACRFGGALREAAHFTRDHGKAAALVA